MNAVPLAERATVPADAPRKPAAGAAPAGKLALVEVARRVLEREVNDRLRGRAAGRQRDARGGVVADGERRALLRPARPERIGADEAKLDVRRRRRVPEVLLVIPEERRRDLRDEPG